MTLDTGQQHHKHELTYALADAAPEGWCRVDLTCRMTVDAHDLSVAVLMADGSRTTMDVPPEVVQHVSRLREGYYRQGVGTWFSLRFLVDPPTRFLISHNLDWDPGWTPALDAPSWARDLAAFPRTPDRIPLWLRQKLGEDETEEPSPEPLGIEELNHRWTRIANLVGLTVPTDWARVKLTYRAIGDHWELPVLVQRLSDGGWYRWDPPAAVAEKLAGLRAGMYRPGRGTWFLAVAEVAQDVSVEYECTWDVEPEWDEPAPVSELVRELTAFPREEARIPAWLKEPVGAVAATTLAIGDPLRAAEDAAAELELDPARYRVGEAAEGAWCLVPEDDRWAVYLPLGGEQLGRAVFGTAAEAVRYFTGQLYLHRAAFRGELPPDAKRPTEDWPIQPVGGDVGLQLYGGKRIVTLPPGTEMDRYGSPSGNTLYAARTEFTHRSQPAEEQELPYHVYRLQRPVRAITGSPIPWYDQAGGGTAYVLERSVAELLADGSMTELEQATTRPVSR